MARKSAKRDDSSELRQRAEKKAAQTPENKEALSPEETRRVLHELRVHQIELEMQNEELRRTQESLEASRARYFDLYDLAPVGYFTLSEEGLILEANLTAATLCGVTRGAMAKQPFSRYVLHEDQGIYYQHRTQLLETGARQVCELRMLRANAAPFWARVEAAAAQDAAGAPVCRAVVSDITEVKQAQQVIEGLARFPEENPAPTMRLRNDGTILYANPASQLVLREWSCAVGQPAPGYLREIVSEAAASRGKRTVEAVCGAQVFLFTIAPVVEEGYVNLYALDITERKRAEEALRESEERYRLLADYSEDFIALHDTQGRRLYVSPSFYRVTGWTPRDLESSDWRMRVHPDDLPTVEQAAAANLRGEITRTEYRIGCKDGRWIWREAICRPILGPGGRVEKKILSSRDITARKQAESALQTTLQRFYFVLSSMYSAVLLVTDEGRVEFTNQAFCDHFGLEDAPTALVGLESRNMIEKIENGYLHPDEAVARIREILDHGQPVKGEELAMRSGGTCLRDFVPLNVHGKPCGRLWIHFDITARKQAEETLRESERRERERAGELAALLDAVPTPVFIVHDPDSIHMTGNRAADELLQHPRGAEASLSAPPEARPRHFRAIKGGRELRLDELPAQRAARGTHVRDFEFSLVFDDGTTRHLLGYGTPLWDDKGRPRGAVHVLVDITARRQAEEALREADRRKDEFLAMLGHELRNPLAPIANAVDLLRGVGPANERQRRAHDMIDRQLTHLVRLVDDLLDISRISHGKILLRKEVFNLVPVVGAAVEDRRPLLESDGLRLDIALPHTPLPIEGDQARITQIVGNLLANAGKFTPKDGRVAVELKADCDGKACITVSDTGMGIEPELLPRIFLPFHQGAHSLEVPHSGLGLGLALVKGLVELHGGAVHVNSAGLGKGAQFIVTLPVQPQLASPQPSAPVAEAAVSPRRVLLIEDNKMAAEGLRMLLEEEGHTVVVARAGSEGIAKAKEFKPELVISDISLAGGLDGHAVARALRQEPDLAKAYMVAYSGFGQEQDKRASLEAGFDEHLTKPIRIADLRRVVAQIHAAT